MPYIVELTLAVCQSLCLRPSSCTGVQEGKIVKAKWHARLVDGWKDLGTELKILHQQPVFLANAWGFVPVQACLGVFTFWGPKVHLACYLSCCPILLADICQSNSFA